MLHRNCVPLSLYNQKCRDFDALLDKYHALKTQGASLPAEPKQGRVVSSGPTPEESAEKRMHDRMLEDIAKDLEKLPGVSKDVARREAAKLREIALGGSIMEGPAV
jgi:hypothetical protein